MNPVPTPKPPYVAVLFSSQRTCLDSEGYAHAATRMEELAAQHRGYLGIEGARGEEGFGITISYWSDLEAAKSWKQNLEHLGAQELGRARWYQSYTVRIAIVEEDYSYSQP